MTLFLFLFNISQSGKAATGIYTLLPIASSRSLPQVLVLSTVHRLFLISRDSQALEIGRRPVPGSVGGKG